MVDYLKGVKMNSVVVMAIQDSTWPWHWKDEWISYVDGYGSETLQNTTEGWLKSDPSWEEYVGCPFTACEFH